MTGRMSRHVAPEPSPRLGAASPAAAEHRATQAVVRAQDPARLTPEARLAELGQILAAGFRRQLENTGQKGLDVCPQSERACETEVVDSLESPTEETA